MAKGGWLDAGFVSDDATSRGEAGGLFATKDYQEWRNSMLKRRNYKFFQSRVSSAEKLKHGEGHQNQFKPLTKALTLVKLNLATQYELVNQVGALLNVY